MTFDAQAKLYLIPVPLGEDSIFGYSNGDAEIIRSIRHYIVESLKPAKRTIYYLYKSRFPECITDFDSLEWYEMQVLSPMEKLTLLRKGLEQKLALGLMSDAGCPAVADPGADLVRLAHELDYEVCPMVGPSSILLALMASGLGGQNFAFNGYLPQKAELRVKKIRRYEQESAEKHQTQIFIETPYRNEILFKELISHLSAQTLLSLAIDLTLPGQTIKTMTVAQWKKNPSFRFNKRPCIFSFLKDI